jgi:hypothetical protein
MDPKFLVLGGVVFNSLWVETADNLNGTGDVHIHFASGNNRTFSGPDADGLRRFFEPLVVEPPAAPKAEALDVAEAQKRWADQAKANKAAADPDPALKPPTPIKK